MLKLMKYEFRKQLYSKIIILVLTLLVEVSFIYGFVKNSQNRMVSSIVLLMFLAFASIFFVSFECIITYSNDLRTKRSYMLFMTPHSSYCIIGAKALSTIVQILVTGLAFVGIAFLDIAILFTRYSSLSQLFEYIQEIFQITVTYANVALILLALICSWIYTVLCGFFSITLSSTFLANKKGKGIVSFGVFLLITYFVFKIIEVFVEGPIQIINGNKLLPIVLSAIFSVLAYFGSAWMLDRKVSL